METASKEKCKIRVIIQDKWC